MSVKNIFYNIVKDRKMIVFCGLLCFNILMYCAAVHYLFSYDGGANDVKTYMEIRSIAIAQGIFFEEIGASFLYGLLFAFPVVYAGLFVRRINLNVIFLQLLPIMITAVVLFYKIIYYG